MGSCSFSLLTNSNPSFAALIINTDSFSIITLFFVDSHRCLDANSHFIFFFVAQENLLLTVFIIYLGLKYNAFLRCHSFFLRIFFVLYIFFFFFCFAAIKPKHYSSNKSHSAAYISSRCLCRPDHIWNLLFLLVTFVCGTLSASLCISYRRCYYTAFSAHTAG